MRIVLLAAVLIACRPALSQICSLPSGLYSKRTRLEERYVTEVGKDYIGKRAIAEEILQEQKEVDQKYLEYMSRVANVSFQAARTCCPPTQQDPVAVRVCSLSLYVKGGRKDVTSFLASVPADEASAHSLWLLDEIGHSQGPGADESKFPFRPLGPVSTYIGELYKLVLTADRDAIRKYLRLFVLAHGTTGDAAEQMEDDVEKLLRRNPALVAENWSIFREYPRALATVDEMMSGDEKREAVSSILKECSAKNFDCNGLSSSLK